MAAPPHAQYTRILMSDSTDFMQRCKSTGKGNNQGWMSVDTSENCYGAAMDNSSLPMQ